MKRLLLLTAMFMSGFGDVFAETDDLGKCIDLSNQINKGTPILVGKHLTLDGTGCMLLLDSLRILYKYTTDAESFRKLKTNNDEERTKWCSSPDQRVALETVKEAISTYFLGSGQYLGMITHRKDGCTSTETTNAPMYAQVEKFLELAVAEISKSLPQYIDSVTILKKVEAYNKSLVFQYELDMDLNVLTDESLLEINQSMGNQLKSQYCMQENLRKFRVLDLPIIYKYTNATGDFLWLNSVDPSDC
tara:strand:+ start:273 stop:1013 length:741 start_codon:yes stop_codon:yes gene_type:complete